jgi:hypothetical protein
MKHILIALLVLSFTGCAIRDAYPIAGAVAGAGGGAAIGGVPGAVIGSGVGYGAGKLGQLADANKDLVKAITEKDVQALLEAGMGKQKGFIEEALDTIYGFIKLCLIGIVIWNLVPIIYTRYVQKKVSANGKDKKSN